MSRITKIIIAVTIALVLLVATALLFFAIPEPAVLPTSAPISEQQEQDNVPGETVSYAEPEIRKTINDIAKKQFGDDAFVIFLSTEGPSEVEIDGIKRTVYIYAADSLSAHKKSGQVRGLYHVDADTGEVFDNGRGTMEKVVIGG